MSQRSQAALFSPLSCLLLLFGEWLGNLAYALSLYDRPWLYLRQGFWLGFGRGLRGCHWFGSLRNKACHSIWNILAGGPFRFWHRHRRQCQRQCRGEPKTHHHDKMVTSVLSTIGMPLGDQRFVIIYCHVLPILDPGLLAGLPRYLVSGKRNLRIICLLPCADDFPYDVVGNTLISQYRKGIVSLRVRLTTQGAAIAQLFF